MGTVTFEVPDDRPVHIFIGDGALAIAAEPPRISTERRAVPQRRRSLLMVAGSLAVLAVGFVLGQHTMASHANAEVQRASTAIPAAPSPAERAFPDHALDAPNLATSGAPAAAQVPPALSQQLTQPPQVVPPPGQPQAAPPRQKNPFGLGD
jgi:hypothetical protein